MQSLPTYNYYGVRPKLPDPGLQVPGKGTPHVDDTTPTTAKEDAAISSLGGSKAALHPGVSMLPWLIALVVGAYMFNRLGGRVGKRKG